MSVDDEVLSTTATVAPAAAAITDVECDSVIPLRIIPSLGGSALVQTLPPTLLDADKDERPRWLLKSIREFLQHGPYYLCLDKVVDLFLAQEARLGYPAKVSKP
jgi:hypothetical protein